MTTVADVMTPGVESTSSTEILCDAARTMREGDFGSMPVVDEGRLVGVLTDRDIVVRAVAERLDPAAVRVGEVASGDPVTVAPGESLDEAMELMARHKVRRRSWTTVGSSVSSVRPISRWARRRRRPARWSSRSRSRRPSRASASYPASNPRSAASTSRGRVARL